MLVPLMFSASARAGDGPAANDAAPPPPTVSGVFQLPPLPEATLPPALPVGPAASPDIELGALPEIRTIANPSLIELRRAAEGPLPTPLYPTAMIGGPAWYGPAPDHPPLLPRLVPDLAARIRYHSHHLFGTSPKPGAAIGPVPVSPGFTWRDWLTSRDDPAIVRR